jgi:hypothetical protein
LGGSRDQAVEIFTMSADRYGRFFGKLEERLFLTSSVSFPARFAALCPGGF